MALLLLFSMSTSHILPVSAEGETETGKMSVDGDEYPLYSTKADMTEEAAKAITDWGIASAADWLAAVTDSNGLTGAFAGKTLHLMNDIDMNSQQMKPLAYAGTFTGVLDGHGYVFENIKIEETISAKTPVGLIGTIGSTGVVQSLGIASGSVSVIYSYTDDGQGIGTIAGSAGSGAVIQHCWNGADVAVTQNTTGKNCSVSGLVGRALNGSTIDGCYNIGTVTNMANGRAAGLNDWGQNTGYAYNSFNAGAFHVSTSGTQSGVYVLRYNNPSTSPYANVYAIGSNVSNKLNDSTCTLDSEAYSNGELAYKLNKGYTEGKGTQVYYTLADYKTVFGTEENQVVRLTLTTISAAGVETTNVYYIPAGTEYMLESGAYQVTEGEESVTIAPDGTFTVPATDVAVTIIQSGMDISALQTQLARYEGKDTKYFRNSEALKTLLESVQMKLNNIGTETTPAYTSQQEIDADVSALETAYVYADVPELPPVVEWEKYSDAPGFMIMNADDLEAAGKAAGSFTAEQTLYLGDDIDLTNSSFNGMNGLKASFDGRDHTVSNYMGTSGFFKLYAGSSIKKMTLNKSSVAGSYAIAALVEQYTNALTVENVVVKDTTVSKAEGDTQNAIAVLVSRSNKGKPVTIRNCVVSDCVLDVTKTAASQVVNVGMIMGQVNADDCIFEHNLSINNKVLGSAFSSIGLYLGECNGANVKLTNSAVWGGGFYASDGVKKPTLGRYGSLVGAFRNGTGKTDAGLTIHNVLVFNTENVDQLMRTDAHSTLTLSNVYHEEATCMKGTIGGTDAVDEATVVRLSQEAFLSGEAMYTANRENSEEDADWAVIRTTDADDETSTMVCFADESNSAPVKVTFTALDNSEAQEGFTRAYYTDSTGIMIGDDVAVTLAVSSEWKAESETAITPPTIGTKFTEDATYTAILKDIGAEVSYVSLSLDGDIGINYYVSLSEDVKHSTTAYMQFAVGENEPIRIFVKDAVKKEIGGTEYFVFTCNVNAIQMAESVKAQLIVSGTDKSPVMEYSVTEYAQTLLNDPSQPQEAKDLVKAMLNYGGYSQIKYAPETVPANQVLEETDRTLAEMPEITDTAYDRKISGTAPAGISYYGSTLILSSRTSIRHYFKLKDGAEANGFTITLSKEGTEAETLTLQEKGGLYYVDVQEINAYDLGTMYTVTVTGTDSGKAEDADTLSITYGFMSYVKGMYNTQISVNEKTNDIISAIYWYHQKAVAYYAYQNTSSEK